MVGFVCFCGCGSHFSRSELNMITWCPIDIGDNVAVVTVTVVIIALITILPNAKCKVQMCRYYIFENAVHNFVQYLYTLSGLIGCVCVCVQLVCCAHTHNMRNDWLGPSRTHSSSTCGALFVATHMQNDQSTIPMVGFSFIL